VAAELVIPPGALEGRRQRLAQYQKRSSSYREQAERLGRLSSRISNFRGLSFGVALIALLVAVFGHGSLIAVALTVLGTSAFAVLVVWHARIFAEEDLAWRWWRVNQNAEARCKDAWRELADDGAEFVRVEHAYAGDLDVFGPGSVFQLMSVAHTPHGKRALAGFLGSAAALDVIAERQAAARALAPELELRQELEALSLGTAQAPHEQGGKKSNVRDLEALLEWAESEPRLSKRRLLVWSARVLPPILIAGLFGSMLFDLSPIFWGVPLLAQMFLTAQAAGEAARIFNIVSATQGAFTRFKPTFARLENTSFDGPLLLGLKQALASGGRPASEQMRRFERALSWFELRHNGMIYPFVTLLLLWDIHCVVALERWQAETGKSLRSWFEALGQWEALSSLGGLAYDNPEFTFPEVVAEPQFDARGLGHPLLAPDVRVENDVSLSGPGQALLVTGSNMSGKSTLLRAMGVAAVMALAGAPVCARRMRVGLVSVHTSMRISDSLSAGVSHFYAELKKLHSTLVATAAGLPVFFLLDEILHGTNSEERQIGARWILAELIRSGALGAVSTHDLGLCQLPEPLLSHVQSVHFRETVQEGKMTFDYRLRRGPVTGGNALRLMRSLGLDVPLPETEPAQHHALSSP
jgi:MutS-like protein